ncbi:hypothetical protein IW140_004339 [Coemansia sp. RSA 1813]|nr:hypothetical protein EV178_004411 [Coemansia sp. RSA 1646]KAJ1769420.1 hypothetical protein LPJ74_004083 [Coemansia sp. RSA 1843]KAJ2087992.1 hypothetical protein IW138_004589 [Coemansia sp. RSA 986]KAJ2211313.1 hypothetical protein EV179_005580 [Coemansia sp. RSA 487]KAJ2567829.1 hypothetical protein IW140_004339 [Coemansia sp. RSA 1813]
MVRLSQQTASWASLALALVHGVSGSLTGSGDVTYNDYEAISEADRATNPPSCGMPYAQLDLSRITAVEAMDTATDCGTCLKVTNTGDTSKTIYVLAVDTGGQGLDLSEPAFSQLFPLTDGMGSAEWSPVDSSYCAGIWNTGSAAASSASTVAQDSSFSSVQAPYSTSSAPPVIGHDAQSSTDADPSSTTEYVPPVSTADTAPVADTTVEEATVSTADTTPVAATTSDEASAPTEQPTSSAPSMVYSTNAASTESVYVPPMETAPAQTTEPPVSRCRMRD